MPFVRNPHLSEALAAFAAEPGELSDLAERVLAERAAGASTGRRAPGVRFDVLTAVLGEFEKPGGRTRVSCVPLDISEAYAGFLCSEYLGIGTAAVLPLRMRSGDLGLVSGMVAWTNPIGEIYEAGVRLSSPLDERAMPLAVRGESARMIDVAAYELSCLAASGASPEVIRQSLERVVAAIHEQDG